MKKLFAVFCITVMMLGGMAMVGCDGEIDNELIEEELEEGY